MTDIRIVAAAATADAHIPVAQQRRPAAAEPRSLPGWRAALQFRSELTFAYAISCAWLALYNVRFWDQTVAAMWDGSPGSMLFMGSLGIVVLALQAVLLLLVPTGKGLRAAAGLLFVVAAATGYFCSAYGVVMNRDMIRNALQTDGTEVAGLMNVELVWHVVLLGLLPALIVWKAKVRPSSWRRRALAIVASLATALALIYTFSDSYAVYFREHKPVRFALVPAAPVTSLIELLASSSAHRGDGPLLNPAGKSQRLGAVRERPLALFVVIGETARAANFQLSGYPRATNPRLSAVTDLLYFTNTVACGTSTAVSVPCLFSHQARSDFDVADASSYTNLLDSFSAANVDVEWRENNSGCKGVCARVRQVSYESDGTSACAGGHCLDEVMLRDLPARLASLERDTVFVFHQYGSHGPAYFERYPAAFERFKPSCRSSQLDRCTPAEVVNAYDNTIAYTDEVLAQQIAILRAATNVDGALLYVSDHGESLGEQGVYLHGLPYAFAPAVQREVPMLMWLSPGYVQRAAVDTGCLKRKLTAAYSHDNVYHTLLAAAEVRNEVYDPGLDILASCRRPETMSAISSPQPPSG